MRQARHTEAQGSRAVLSMTLRWRGDSAPNRGRSGPPSARMDRGRRSEEKQSDACPRSPRFKESAPHATDGFELLHGARSGAAVGAGRKRGRRHSNSAADVFEAARHAKGALSRSVRRGGFRALGQIDLDSSNGSARRALVSSTLMSTRAPTRLPVLFSRASRIYAVAGHSRRLTPQPVFVVTHVTSCFM